ncbi:hypothetical protein BYT27DRAFT_7092581 [Phlegmacium glaucopus]|nr:hypothetical protein BYT27DRAFT_7092581 [Phlegmacium glaucopus]
MPNPFDILCSLPPESALQILAARYITIGTLSVFVWETLNNMRSDYKLLFERRIRFPTVMYFISRLLCLGLTISATIFQTTPLPGCNVLAKTLNILYALTIISSSLLFFLRTRAIFDKNTWVIAFFLGSWLVVVAACMAYAVRLDETKIRPDPGFCEVLGVVKPFERLVKPFSAVATIVPLINDTLVFLAIAWRLFCNSYAPCTLRNGVRIFIFGDYLPAFSKALLQDGQAYYLTTVTVSLVTVIMLFDYSVPEILQVIVEIPNVTLMNIMACRVFRNTILGSFGGTQISTDLISKELNADPLFVWEQGLGAVGRRRHEIQLFNIDGIATT